MAKTYIVPARLSIGLAEEIADDILSKVLDLPSIIYPSVAVAVHTAAQEADLEDDLTWQRVYTVLYDYLTQIFHRNVDINDDDEMVVWIDERLGLDFVSLSEMEVVIHYLTETVIDGLAEYDLSSVDDWDRLVRAVNRECRVLPLTRRRWDIKVNIRRQTLMVVPAPQIA